MEIFACLAGGAGLIICGVALTRLRPPNWKDDGDLLDEHQQAIEWWTRIQRYVRLVNNGLLSTIGGAIMASVCVPRGRAWMVLWCAILILLLISILFAMLDALSSLAAYRRALPEAARRSFSSQAKS